MTIGQGPASGWLRAPAHDNSTGATFGSIVIGGAGVGEANTFKDGLDYFIYLNGDTFANSQTSGRPNYAAYGSTTIAPFPESLDVSGNSFDGLNDFRIEDKMHHRMDTDAPVSTGLLTWVSGNVYVTTPGGGSTDSSIQRGVDAARLRRASNRVSPVTPPIRSRCRDVDMEAGTPGVCPCV